MKSRFDFNSVSELTGAFVILAFLTVAVLLTMTARVQSWFEPVYTINLILPSEDKLPAGAELLQDAEVVVSATTVGRVVDIQSEEGADGSQVITAVLRLQGDPVKQLRADASAKVSLPFLAFLGEPSIKITKGSRSEPLLFADGEKTATLTSEEDPEGDLQEQLRDWNDIALQWNEKANKWEIYFDEWNATAHKWEVYMEEWNERAHEWEERLAVTYAKLDRELSEPDGRFLVFMDNMNLLLDHLANEGLLAWATRDPEWDATTKDLMANLQLGARETAELMDVMNALLVGGRPLPAPFAETVAELPEMARRANELLERTDKVLAEVELASASLPQLANTVEKEMRTLPGLLIESQETLRQVEIMVRALQRHWLLRDYVNPRPSSGRIPVDQVVGPLGGER